MATVPITNLARPPREKSCFDKAFILNQIVDDIAIDSIINVCDWLETAKKTTIAFGSCILDTAALTNGLLKPLKGNIFLVKAILDGLKISEVLQGKKYKNNPAVYIGSVVKHAFRTAGDLVGGFRFLGSVGIICLSPCLETLGVIKGGFTIGASVVSIALCIIDLWESYNKRVEEEAKIKEETAEESKEAAERKEKAYQKLEWSGYENLSTIVTSTCSILLSGSKVLAWKASSVFQNSTNTLLVLSRLFSARVEYLKPSEEKGITAN